MALDEKQKKAIICMIISDITDDDDDYVNVRGRTREWVKKREEKGAFNNIVYELRIQDSDTYKEMMRMTYDTFCVLLNYIEPYISPTERYFGTKVIKATERLVLTFRFLATGETFKSLSYQFRISTNARGNCHLCWKTFPKNTLK